MIQKYLLVALVLSCLSACPSTVEQSVNVSISPELLETLRGGSGSHQSDKPTTPLPTPAPDVSVETGVYEAISQMISDNANALNNQNYPAYIDTIHPQSGLTEDMTALFHVLLQYNTKYFIDEVTILDQSENEAEILVQQRISDIGGMISSQLFYTVVKDGNRWKIFDIATDPTGFY